MDIFIKLPAQNLRDTPTLLAAIHAFGIPSRELEIARDRNIDLNIKCTDTQFGQFIAKRAVGGCPNNQIRVFNIKILSETAPVVAPYVFNPNFDVR